MSKSGLIQFVFIIVGIVAAYNGVEQFLNSFLYYLLAYLANPYAEEQGLNALSVLLSCACYGVVAFFLIARSRTLAAKVIKKSNLEESFKVSAKPNQLIYVLLVVVAVYELMKQAPRLVTLLYSGFSEKVSGVDSLTGKLSPRDWIIVLFNLLLPFLLIAIADKLAVYFAEKIRPAEEDNFIIEETP
ncbi:MAG: hypothetical protein QM731_11400 [Chitinophagaceae bacterium]